MELSVQQASKVFAEAPEVPKLVLVVPRSGKPLLLTHPKSQNLTPWATNSLLRTRDC